MPRCLRPGLQLGSGRARSLGFRQVLRGPIPRLHLGSPSPVAVFAICLVCDGCDEYDFTGSWAGI